MISRFFLELVTLRIVTRLTCFKESFQKLIMPTRSKGYLTTSMAPKVLSMPDIEKHPGYAMNWWKRYSYQLRATNPTCNECNAILNPRQLVVDHIIPVRFGGSFDDKRNHQVLCLQCHNKKTAKEKSTHTTPSRLNEQNKLIPQ